MPVDRQRICTGSYAETDGIAVTVSPEYLADKSDPLARQFLFSYTIRIENRSARTVRLRSRRWLVVSATGERDEVSGPGVVGQQPELAPGEQFEYTSFCPLRTHWGAMEGAFTFVGADGTTFDATIARFYLVAPEPGQ